MLKQISSPMAVSALLLLAGATAVPTAITLDNNEFLQWGVGIFTLGAVFITFLLLMKIWRWEQFARIKAIGRGYMFLLMNAATVALFPAAVLHLRIIGQMYPDRYMHNDALGMALAGAWSLGLFALIATNILFLIALPHTTLPAQMTVRCKRRSKELYMWRVIFAILLFIDIIYLALCVSCGAVMGIVAAAVYMYVIFALHAGKVAWKDGIRA